MKLIKINESQRKRLFEAYKQGFSFDELTMIADSAFAEEDNSVPQMAYCTKWLGQPSFMGSSRCVYTLSDNIILKLAYGGKYRAGIAQNKLEYELYEKSKSPILPIVYDCDKNFTYLVCESVVPANNIDFEKILGIPFYLSYEQTGSDYEQYFENPKKWNENSDIDIYKIMCYLETNYAVGESYFDRELEEVIMKTPWLRAVRNFMAEYKIGDLCKVDNFGIVNRDGKPSIVLLDAGLDVNVWEKYYR